MYYWPDKGSSTLTLSELDESMPGHIWELRPCYLVIYFLQRIPKRIIFNKQNTQCFKMGMGGGRKEVSLSFI